MKEINCFSSHWWGYTKKLLLLLVPIHGPTRPIYHLQANVLLRNGSTLGVRYDLTTIDSAPYLINTFAFVSPDENTHDNIGYIFPHFCFLCISVFIETLLHAACIKSFVSCYVQMLISLRLFRMVVLFNIALYLPVPGYWQCHTSSRQWRPNCWDSSLFPIWWARPSGGCKQN